MHVKVRGPPCRSHLSSSSVWVLGTELKSYGIATHALSNWAFPASLHGDTFQINHVIHWALTCVSSGIKRHWSFVMSYFALKYFTMAKVTETKTQTLHSPAFWWYTAFCHRCFQWDNIPDETTISSMSFSFPPLSGGTTLLKSVFSHCARKDRSVKTMWHSFVELSQCVASA